MADGIARVVLDTNILISSCWKPGGNEWRVVALVREGKLTACVSPALLEEYADVVARKKFAAHRAGLEEAAGFLRRSGIHVEPESRCEACTDADDNRLLECAEAAGANFVVTGNLRHFPQEWKGTRVVNARKLLEQMGLIAMLFI